MSRIADFDNILNFRDFGDYPARHGGRLRPGILYRSGHHARASAADLARLGALGLTMLTDLRRPDERLKDPSRRPDPFGGLLIETGDDCDPEPPFLSLLSDPDLNEEGIARFMRARYRTYPFDRGISGAYRRFFHALAEAEGPVLVHCAAGKDRTGVLVALVHHLAGVHRDDMIGDYLLTNAAARIAERLPAMAETLERSYNRRVPEELIRMIWSVRTEYLEEAFTVIRERHGSLDSYLSDWMGITPEMRERIVTSLTQ